MEKHKHSKSTIEINGKTYNPHTGRQVSDVGATAPMRQSIDGVLSHGSSPALAPKITQPKRAHTVAKHAKRPVSRSRTLVRHAVVKPPTAHRARRQAPAESIVQHELIARGERAKKIQKSHLIQKFSSNQTAAHRPQPPAKPKDSHAKRTQPLAIANASAVASSNSIADFEQALEKASSHLQKMPAKSRRRKPKAGKGSLAMVAAVIVLMVGFFAWQNTPSIRMKLAARNANIPASLPDYSPAGFSVDKDIIAQPGLVSVSYKSESGGQAFSITQQASDWDDSTLYASYVEPRDGQTFEGHNKKIYLIDGSNATWVDNGIWYRVTGTAKLSVDQLQRIANSL